MEVTEYGGGGIHGGGRDRPQGVCPDPGDGDGLFLPREDLYRDG